MQGPQVQFLGGERSPGGRNGNPLQDFYLGEPMGREVWWGCNDWAPGHAHNEYDGSPSLPSWSLQSWVLNVPPKGHTHRGPAVNHGTRSMSLKRWYLTLALKDVEQTARPSGWARKKTWNGRTACPLAQETGRAQCVRWFRYSERGNPERVRLVRKEAPHALSKVLRGNEDERAAEACGKGLSRVFWPPISTCKLSVWMGAGIPHPNMTFLDTS